MSVTWLSLAMINVATRSSSARPPTPAQRQIGNDTAIKLLRGGAKLVGVCADRLYPSRHGLEIGCGAFCAMLAYAAGTRPTFCGKPEASFFHDACRLIGAEPSQCLMIGDNLDADILGAKAVGMRAGLVLGGVSTQKDVADLPDDLRPAFVADDLRAVLDAFG